MSDEPRVKIRVDPGGDSSSMWIDGHPVPHVVVLRIEHRAGELPRVVFEVRAPLDFDSEFPAVVAVVPHGVREMAREVVAEYIAGMSDQQIAETIRRTEARREGRPPALALERCLGCVPMEQMIPGCPVHDRSA